MTDYIESYYAQTRTGDASRPPLEGYKKARVCVVGGGLAGLNTALGLAERGVKDVVLLEGRRVGWGASGRNGGFVGTGYQAGAEALIKRVGLEHTKKLHQLTVDAVHLVKARIAKYGIECGPNPDGQVAASWFDNPDELKAWRDFAAENFGEQQEFIPRERLKEEFCDSPVYYDGLFHRGVFWFHPLNYCLGIARAAESLGVTIHENTTAVMVDGDRASKLVVTDRGEVEADELVFTLGGYLNGVVAELNGAVQPAATYVMTTEPIEPGLLESAIKCPNAIHDTRFMLDYYRRLEDGRILWGGRGTMRLSEPGDLKQMMLGDLLKVYPQLKGVKPQTAWLGYMSYARHRMVQLGALKPGFWYAQAFGGHGMGTTTVAGEVLASAIAEGDDSWRLFEPFGLSWAGGPFGKLYGGYLRRSATARDRARIRRQRARQA
jgi:gamma-glutamylputrescine oxidase